MEEEPIAMNSIVRLLSASNNQSESVQSVVVFHAQKERKKNQFRLRWMGFCNVIQLFISNATDPSFRIVHRGSAGGGDSRFSRVVNSRLSYSVVTVRALDWAQKVAWMDLLQRQM